uniref:Integrase catalytic domain-containing protein n=1 Tax=Rhabditophanes sp. KR3021 TaxID=114890 RepID=A0AC35UHS8_9BILA
MDEVGEEVLNGCIVCLRTKYVSHKKPTSWAPATYPRERGFFDLAYIEKKTVIVLVDSFSKFTMAEVLRNKEADTLIDFFEKIFKEYKFMYVVSDNEPALTSEKLEEFFNTQGVYHQTSVPYCPQSNGQVERRIGMIKKKTARFVLEGECVRNAVTKSLNAMNYFASTSSYATPVQKYFIGTIKWVRSHDFRYSKLILDWRFYKKRPTGRPRERYLNMYQKKKQFGVASTKSHTNLGSLKKALKKAWKEMSMEIVTNACKSITGRLNKCIAAKGVFLRSN